MPLKAWEMLILISEYLGGPQTAVNSGQHLAPMPRKKLQDLPVM